MIYQLLYPQVLLLQPSALTSLFHRSHPPY